MTQQRVLFIGGSGFIGSAALKELSEQRPDLALSVFSTGKRRLAVSGVETFVGSLLDFNSLLPALEKADYIVQCVQFPGHPVERPWLGSQYTYKGCDGAGTQNIVRALEHLGRVDSIQNYLYLSGAAVGESKYNWNVAKRMAEKALRDSGVKHVILRPSWVYGKGDRSMSLFVLFARYLPFFPLIGSGENRLNPVWVKDLAKIIAAALLDEHNFGNTLNIGSPQLTMREVAKIVLAETGQSKPLVAHPLWMMKSAGLFAQFLPFSPLSPGSVDFLNMDAPLEPYEEMFGVHFKSLAEGLKASGMLR